MVLLNKNNTNIVIQNIRTLVARFTSGTSAQKMGITLLDSAASLHQNQTLSLRFRLYKSLQRLSPWQIIPLMRSWKRAPSEVMDFVSWLIEIRLRLAVFKVFGFFQACRLSLLDFL
jgi:hypothetical protein